MFPSPSAAGNLSKAAFNLQVRVIFKCPEVNCSLFTMVREIKEEAMDGI